MDNKKETCMSTVIRVAILTWAAGLLTASYAGLLAKMDPTFIATVFTASAATFGINTMKKGDDDEKKQEQPTEEVIETLPPPPRPEPVYEEPSVAQTEELPLVETSLEERVEALEAKVDEEKPYERGEL